MTKPKILTPTILKVAQSHLGRADRIMAKLIRTHGPCSLAKRSFDLFHTLVVPIISQQLSAKASDTIERRIAECIPSPFKARK